jgi:hypothetical protein
MSFRAIGNRSGEVKLADAAVDPGLVGCEQGGNLHLSTGREVQLDDSCFDRNGHERLFGCLVAQAFSFAESHVQSLYGLHTPDHVFTTLCDPPRKILLLNERF